jgi:succinate dehydrogenase/fumarate reductase flavoprotein subunit
MGGVYSQAHSVCAILEAMRAVQTDKMTISYVMKTPKKMQVQTGEIMETEDELITVTVQRNLADKVSYLGDVLERP